MKSESVLVIHFWLSLCSSLCFSLAEVVGNIESVAIGELGAAGTSGSSCFRLASPQDVLYPPPFLSFHPHQ